MTIEEIEERIELCKKREVDYLESGNSRQASKYSEEAYKWEELLNQLDSNLYQEKEEYKRGYYRLERELEEIGKILDNLAYGGNEDCYMESVKKVLNIVNKEFVTEISSQKESVICM